MNRLEELNNQEITLHEYYCPECDLFFWTERLSALACPNCCGGVDCNDSIRITEMQLEK